MMVLRNVEDPVRLIIPSWSARKTISDDTSVRLLHVSRWLDVPHGLLFHRRVPMITQVCPTSTHRCSLEQKEGVDRDRTVIFGITFETGRKGLQAEVSGLRTLCVGCTV